MMSKLVRLGLSAGLVFILTIASSPSPSEGAQRLRFATSFRGPHFEILALAAEEKGFWQRNGLEVEWFSMQGGSRTMRALAARAFDMGITTPTTVIQAVSRRVPALIVADLKLRENWRVWVSATGPVKGPADLRGAKIGISRFGGTAYANAKVLVKGLGLEKEVQFVAVGGLSRRIAALKTAAIDAFPLGEIAATSLKIKGEVRGIGSLRRYQPRKWSDLVVFTHRKFSSANPETIARAIKAIFESTDYIWKNSSWTLARLESHSKLSPKAAKAVFKLLNYGLNGNIDRQMIENVAKFLLDYEIVPKDSLPPIDQLYSNRYIPR
ncbi:MAG: ABC transporter substrate-binding protein [Thermodesulfobacteriota bacterium]